VSRSGPWWAVPVLLALDAEQIYLDQSYTSSVAGLPDTGAWLTNLSVVKESRGKRARLGVEIRNLFDEEFNVAVEGFSVVQLYPTLQALGFAEWNF